MEKTFVLTVEDGNVSIEKAEENENPVTEEELQKINNAVRSQLTGELMTVQIQDSSYKVLLEMYLKWKNGKTEAVRQQAYFLFRDCNLSL